ncbi:MAG: GGDEF domain-containing protein [Lachnospiraceae bacterium]|nr:GGDEF domain-containing protein [Lachnospiraceae bacterium]
MDNIFKKKKIAVFVNGWSGEFIELVLEGIRKRAAEYGVDIFVFVTYIYWGQPGPQSNCQLNIMHLPDPKEFDGAIVLANTFNVDAEKNRVRGLFQKAGVPMVSTEVKLPDMAVVGTDNYSGMSELATHLIEKHNVRKIVYVDGIEGNEECAVRKKAIVDVLSAHGLELFDSVYGSFGYYQATVHMEEWLKAGKSLPDAFICANDLMAIGVITTLTKYGYEVPRDVIVTGFDNIKDARNFFPIIASVSRQWDLMGERAFDTLMLQIEKPDPDYSMIYNSKFIANESCGCESSPEAIKSRLDTARNGYGRLNTSEMLDIFFQDMRVPMSKVENKEQFFETAVQKMGTHDFVGDDYCLCTEPLFFELDDDNYPKRIRGYSRTMDVIYGRRDGQDVEQRTFDSSEMYPGYVHEEGRSNTYILVPLNSGEFIIGYLVIRNNPQVMYSLQLRKFVTDMNGLFMTIRQYIFAQQTNRKLKEIYMTDFLTNMYNRTGCENVLFSYIEDSKKQGNDSILVFADINYMKIINDDYGHLSGDSAIRATAEAMHRAFPGEWLFGRYGGDEFVAVGELDPEKQSTLKSDFYKALEDVKEEFKLRFMLSVSVGYTVIRPDDTGTIADYISTADESMYEEKQRAHKQIEEYRKKYGTPK